MAISFKKLLPVKRNEFQERIAYAFYIYDIFKFFIPYTKQKRNDLRKERDNQIKKVKSERGFLPVNQLHCYLTSFRIKIINMMPCVAFSISSRNTCLLKGSSKIMTTATLLRQDWRFCAGYGLLFTLLNSGGEFFETHPK